MERLQPHYLIGVGAGQSYYLMGRPGGRPEPEALQTLGIVPEITAHPIEPLSHC